MAERSCGSCRECCIHVAVQELNKPRGVPCDHLLPVINECGACGIYEQRPSACASFKCSWLDGDIHEDLKPDACGVVFESGSIQWPKPLRIIIGFATRPDFAKNFARQCNDSTSPGTIIGVVDQDKNEMSFFGAREDVEVFTAFRQACLDHGSVTVQQKDGATHVAL